MIVLDASAAIEWLLQTRAGFRVAELLFSKPQVVHAPHLLDVELLHVLRRCEAEGTIRPPRAQEALQDFLDLPITRHSHEHLFWRIWDLRDNLAAYDAAYVALAESLGATLLTCDAKIAAAPGHCATVQLV
ncbi:MAG TPA: type II toxin-antitoxin system VapC family toxin [Candidatus Acidoferrales bacterium]|nr:type II toxin-antitoxin system VapC family toxin [Candidatus Acidoferrales bacterium]